ncbi:Polygalacturonase [Sesamum angolense]|uniref:Polygalacturonase n=1 Tax=Sesamum angolense TaxID=2727404 RepID=A0AAE2BZA4_9LAMI|nr:Polygalacturonase [Sesamum angolense]
MVSRKMMLILIFTFFYYTSSFASNPSYNVKSFGAISDGESDSTKAFLSAWFAACATTQPAAIYVPPGRYLLRNAFFNGKTCKNKAITIRIDGTLVAPSDYNTIGKSGTWLKFQKVTGVSISGGTLDGQGTKLWACKNSSKSCPKGATSLAFYSSNNISIDSLSSLNSQMFHILIYNCHNANLNNLKISAPVNSPNTDGIHLQQSSGVTITNSRIGTGDDCVSVGPGTSNLWIENLSCGPGHGISIGSLGWDLQEAGVENVTVKMATFSGTENGVSGVKISDITYQDVHGTSATEVAVKFDCSKSNPCTGITLDRVNLTYGDKPAIASCAYAGGTASADVEPNSCL